METILADRPVTLFLVYLRPPGPWQGTRNVDLSEPTWDNHGNDR
ncbi:MAG TPA: hypothetical protein PLC79_06465 [Phycisphaerae bacterium]|nr:hypothetical protein [Phycisphaerae bacterium]